MPPPLPPPSGLTTLGPSELRAVAGCRHLRRLELDVSLRSAALGVAAVQLVAKSCPNLEVRDETTWNIRVNPSPTAAKLVTAFGKDTCHA